MDKTRSAISPPVGDVIAFWDIGIKSNFKNNSAKRSDFSVISCEWYLQLKKSSLGVHLLSPPEAFTNITSNSALRWCVTPKNGTIYTHYEGISWEAGSIYGPSSHPALERGFRQWSVLRFQTQHVVNTDRKVENFLPFPELAQSGQDYLTGCPCCHSSCHTLSLGLVPSPAQGRGESWKSSHRRSPPRRPDSDV